MAQRKCKIKIMLISDSEDYQIFSQVIKQISSTIDLIHQSRKYCS